MAPDMLCAGVSRRRLLGIGAALARHRMATLGRPAVRGKTVGRPRVRDLAQASMTKGPSRHCPRVEKAVVVSRGVMTTWQRAAGASLAAPATSTGL